MCDLIYMKLHIHDYYILHIIICYIYYNKYNIKDYDNIYTIIYNIINHIDIIY